MVRVRLSHEHEIVRDGRRVMVPAGQTVEVSEHQYHTFRDRMDLVADPETSKEPQGEPEPETAPQAENIEPETVEGPVESVTVHAPAYEIVEKKGGWRDVVVAGTVVGTVREGDLPAKLAELGLE